MDIDPTRYLNIIIENVHEMHKVALRRHWHDIPNIHFDNLIQVVNESLKFNPQIIECLFDNEKCKTCAVEVIAKSIKTFLLYGGDIADVFSATKLWYNEHGIQWTEDRLLLDKQE
jgi:hypothetical protein